VIETSVTIMGLVSAVIFAAHAFDAYRAGS
jgi:hypothetical protein